MNDQFPPPSWFMRPETWPYWMPNSLLGARTPPTPPGDTWDAPWPATSRGGILGSLTRPTEELWANPVGSDGAASGDADKLAGTLVPTTGSQSESKQHVLVGYVSRRRFWASWDGRPDD